MKKLIFLLLILLFSTSVEAARSKQKPRLLMYGRIEVATNPGGYPVLIDNQPYGETSPAVRHIDLEPGKHKMEILFPNGLRWVRDFTIEAGRKHCVFLNFEPRTITRVKPVCPYTMKVSSPTYVTDGDMITFTSDVFYKGTAPLNYRWELFPEARIVSGQGTNTITVDSTGLGQKSIMAVLKVDDGSGDPNCENTARSSTTVHRVPPPVVVPRPFDNFPSISFDDDKARLDNLAIELQNTPGAKAHIIVYGRRSSRPAQIETLVTRTRNYLVKTRGIDSDRVVVVSGGYRDRDTLEFFIVPQGANPPGATPGFETKPRKKAAR
jgi:hypothetical protein